MRRSTRTFVSVLAATPLLLGAFLPANAAEQGKVKSSGSFAHLDISGPETSDTIPGNYLMGDLQVMDSQAMGWATAFECADGATPMEGEGCTYVGDLMLDGAVTVSKSSGKTKATNLAGDLWVGEWVYDPETGEESVIDHGTLALDASLPPYGKSVTSTYTESFRDKNTGESYTVRARTTTFQATVSGTLGGSSLDGNQGSVGTFRSMQTWRTP